MKTAQRVMVVATGAAAAAATIAHPMEAGRADTNATTLIALVAANATDPFNNIITDFEAAHSGVTVSAEYAGTQILETQLEQGAPADLFLSADLSHIKALQAEGLVGDYRLVAKGHEVIVVPAGNPAGISSLQDLGTKPNKLVIGVETVPIGIYTRQILDKASADYGAGFSQSVLAHAVSLESNVKQILEKVALGEADAGIVYRTDVTPDVASKVTVIDIPPQYEVEAENYIAVVTKSPHAALAGDLMSWALGSDGQAIFK
ncbi:MAG TPA: molybdate ABC transporter substrate-binding protein, partial [Candidatus Eremiobacteraceae bacterium]|nr:molybdate ABC transporter substrate-binding protein [Candidatus Eremiobacteraceae bacterium]